jgi:hypothetical protein
MPQVTTEIAADALTTDWTRPKPASGLVHKSKRGNHYASKTL